MQREGYFLLLILLASALGHLSSGPGLKHECIHDELVKQFPLKGRSSLDRLGSQDLGDAQPLSHLQDKNTNPDPKFSSQFTGSMPANVDGWHQMRIYLNFSLTSEYVKQFPAQNTKFQMASRLTQNVRKYFQDSLAVQFFEKFDYPGMYVESMNLTIHPFSLPTDLYVLIWPEDKGKEGYYAAAGALDLSIVDERPCIGIYYLNFGPLETTVLHNLFLHSTFAHEFTHILGFTGGLIPYFKDPVTGNSLTDIVETKKITSSNGGSETFTFIKTKEVVDFARQYYGCPTLTGMPLENNGGSGSVGSHWEKLFLPTEYMNPTVENPGIISGFTFAFLRGTGWYMTKVDAAQYYDWGKGEGCKYFSICPSTKNGAYCAAKDKGQPVCSSEYYSKSVCYSDTRYSSADCPVRTPLLQVCTMDPLPHPNGYPVMKDEEFGPGSRCILWKATDSYGTTKNTPKCHKTYCEKGQVKIKVGTKVYSCPKDIDQKLGVIKISDERGVLTTMECPNAADFCEEFAQRCPEDCNNNGICIGKNRCNCFIGFTGPSCKRYWRVLEQEETTHFE